MEWVSSTLQSPIVTTLNRPRTGWTAKSFAAVPALSHRAAERVGIRGTGHTLVPPSPASTASRRGSEGRPRWRQLGRRRDLRTSTPRTRRPRRSECSGSRERAPPASPGRIRARSCTWCRWLSPSRPTSIRSRTGFVERTPRSRLPKPKHPSSPKTGGADTRTTGRSPARRSPCSTTARPTRDRCCSPPSFGRAGSPDLPTDRPPRRCDRPCRPGRRPTSSIHLEAVATIRRRSGAP